MSAVQMCMHNAIEKGIVQLSQWFACYLFPFLRIFFVPLFRMRIVIADYGRCFIFICGIFEISNARAQGRKWWLLKRLFVLNQCLTEIWWPGAIAIIIIIMIGCIEHYNYCGYHCHHYAQVTLFSSFFCSLVWIRQFCEWIIVWT